MDHHSPFVPLLLITLLAVVVPIIVHRMRTVVRLPIVVGEIVAGILIGQSGFGLVEQTAILDFLAEFGFTFLMFLSGLELNFDLLAAGAATAGGTRRWQRPIPLALISFSLTVLLAILIGLGVVSAGLARNPILMGLIMSTTSLGIVVPVLKERRLTSSAYGQIVLVSALISDFVTLLLLSVAIAIASSGLSLDLLLFMVLLAAFAAAAKIGLWASRVPVLSLIVKELSHATAQIHVRGALALMVSWAVLAESLGVEVILGAFLAGAIISLTSRGHEHELREKLDAIGYGFFIPIFFIMVGARFDLGALLASPSAILLVPLLIIAAYLVKLLPAMLLRTLFPWRETLAAGVLLSSRLSLIVAASAIALDLEMISSATNSAIILVAVVTCTLSPVLFTRLLPAKQSKRRRGVIILGTEPLAELVGGRLRQHGEQVTFIGRDEGMLRQLNEAGYRVVFGSPGEEHVLEQAGAGEARALVALTNDPAIVIHVCRLARERYQIPTIVARADDPLLVQDLHTLQVQVVQPALATALALEGALHFPAAFNMLLDKSDDVDVIDVPLHNPMLAGQALRRVRLPGNALVLGIRRGSRGEVVVPHGDTVLELGDVLMLVGSPSSLHEAQLRLDGSEG